MMPTLYPLDWSNARFFAGRPAAYRHVTTGDWDVPAAKIRGTVLALGAHEIAAVNRRNESPQTRRQQPTRQLIALMASEHLLWVLVGRGDYC